MSSSGLRFRSGRRLIGLSSTMFAAHGFLRHVDVSFSIPYRRRRGRRRPCRCLRVAPVVAPVAIGLAPVRGRGVSSAAV